MVLYRVIKIKLKHMSSTGQGHKITFSKNAAQNTHKVLEYIISHFCILLSLITLASYSFMNQFGLLPKNITPETILLSFSFTLALFLLGFSDKVKADIAKIGLALEVFNEDRADIRIITSQAGLYELMTEKIKNAKKNVCIMHLDHYPPTHFANEARTAYFKFIFDFGKANENVLMRRITTINSREKGEWVKGKMIETQDEDNLNIAYISAANLDSTSLKTVVSCQIVDDMGVFIMNPLSNTVSGSGNFPNCWYIENKKVVKLYQQYYDTLFTFAELQCNGCQMLKNGRECDFEALDRIIAQLPEELEKKYVPTPDVNADAAAGKTATVCGS